MTSKPHRNVFITVDRDAPDPERLAPAAEALRAGGVVVFPTETVYGLGVLPDAPDAAARLNALKGRASDQPLTVHLAPSAELSRFAAAPTPLIHRMLGRFMPGPLTLIVPADARGESVGIRVPAHAACAALLEAVGGALLGSSANLTGAPAPTRADAVSAEILGRVGAAIDAGPCRFAAASTVIRAAGDRPEILREGAIPSELILDESGPVTLLVCTGNTCRSPMAAALLEDMLRRRFGRPRSARGLPLPAVRSAGVAAMSGAAASPNAVNAMANRGLDLRQHQAGGLDSDLIGGADFILTMSEGAARAVCAFAPDCAARVQILNRARGGIPDPFAGSLPVYEAAAEAITAALDPFLDANRARFSGGEG